MGYKNQWLVYADNLCCIGMVFFFPIDSQAVM